MGPTHTLMRIMTALVTLSAVVFAWRSRQRDHTLLAAFFAGTLALDLVRVANITEPYPGWGWYLNCLLFLVQVAAMPALCLVVLLKRPPWPAVVGLGVALALVVLSPRSTRWLYKAAHVAAVAGSLTCLVVWLRRRVELTIAAAVVILFVGIDAIGAVIHNVLMSDGRIWRIYTATIACIMLLAAGLLLRGAMTRAEEH